MISRLYFTILSWGINRIGALGGSPKEKVPMHMFGYWGRIVRSGNDARRLRPNGPIRPDVRFADWPNTARLNDLHGLAKTVLGRSLVAHLRRHFVFGGNLFHHAGFLDVVRQRLLTINVLAHLHRHDAG